MTSRELDAYFRAFLDLEGFLQIDSSLNGIQVDNNGADITKVAFAVDACMESFIRAAECGAGMLFTHHGLYWGSPIRIAGEFRTRIEYLLKNNLALYAVHLPLDQNPERGNNAVLAEKLGIKNPLPFGLYHGRKIGYKGSLAESLSLNDAVSRISFMGRPPAVILPFGKKINESCAVVSGGAAMEAMQAMEEGIDLYVTGETSHSIYHLAQEGRINIIAGGHYSTEVWGMRKVMECLAAELGLDVEFIDLPTGL
ncbi:MAG: Nif3-like dinuclear metal center hexameric protein [Spirochaetaceae bacterium]|jgi:dinuclear metal center YbgI/SA1388 family protein|nr:Nif3-like dinuclear metal center hexameric protein [Spirochaetaceae bacterium]